MYDNEDVLQWGHGSEAVDNQALKTELFAERELQWGHGSEAVDNMRRISSESERRTSFNGATAQRPWIT